MLSIEVSAPGHLILGSLGSPGSKTNSNTKEKAATSKSKTIEVELVQDVTGLRSRVGDTGSVIWRAR